MWLAMTTGWSSLHVGLPGLGSSFCGSPQMKDPGPSTPSSDAHQGATTHLDPKRLGIELCGHIDFGN